MKVCRCDGFDSMMIYKECMKRRIKETEGSECVDSRQMIIT